MQCTPKSPDKEARENLASVLRDSLGASTDPQVAFIQEGSENDKNLYVHFDTLAFPNVWESSFVTRAKDVTRFSLRHYEKAQNLGGVTVASRENVQPGVARLHHQRSFSVAALINRFIAISMAVALSAAAPSLAAAQETPKAFVAPTTDSSAWQRVLIYTVGALSAELVRNATDPAAQPWRLDFPSDDPQEGLIREQLRTILRMRQVMPADTLVRSLEFGKLVISGDTARVDVRFTEMRTCPGTGRTTGLSWSTTVLVPRDPVQKFWGAARSLSTRVGDRLPC